MKLPVSVAELVSCLYTYMLRREPSPDELKLWIKRLSESGHSIQEIFRLFANSDEFKRKSFVHELPHPIGHYYSPIVNISELDLETLVSLPRTDMLSIAAVDFRFSEQVRLWNLLQEFMRSYNFPRAASPGFRYFWGNDVYAFGDSLVLSSLIQHFRPRRIIEIGSGFSSACMLDSCDLAKLDTVITFIDPDPARLKKLLKESDFKRCVYRKDRIQDVDKSIFRELKGGDILFIDSSHVVKTGSDVVWDVFEILPLLDPGVIVHFHDIFYPFEYPADWILKRRYSWNEIYLIRSFLMFNSEFKILFFNDAFSKKYDFSGEELNSNHVKMFKMNPGGGLWLQRS